MFERFLSIHRKGTVPDVDVDIGSSKREELFRYTIEKHGRDRCALVSTSGIRKAKSAIKDVARILNIDLETSEAVAKLIPTVWYPDDGDKMTDLDIPTSLKLVHELREYQKQYPKWFELAIKLEGLPRTSSIHAAGTLIATQKLSEKIPLRKKSEDSFIDATALNLHDAETAGFIKFCERKIG